MMIFLLRVGYNMWSLYLGKYLQFFLDFWVFLSFYIYFTRGKNPPQKYPRPPAVFFSRHPGPVAIHWHLKLIQGMKVGKGATAGASPKIMAFKTKGKDRNLIWRDPRIFGTWNNCLLIADLFGFNQKTVWMMTFSLSGGDSVDGWNPANQLVGSLSHYRVSYIPGGARFQPSTVSFQEGCLMDATEVPYGCKLWSSPSRSSPNPGGSVCEDFARKISTHLFWRCGFLAGFLFSMILI